MTENQWVELIKSLLLSANLPSDIRIDTLRKLPYAREILEYDKDFEPKTESSIPFETDLLLYEQSSDVIKPRVVIEGKLFRISTHDAITYSYKAQSHKAITPFIRYGIMIGNRASYPLPGRLYRHGSNFDFMISFVGTELSEAEKTVFIELINKEISYSKQYEEMLLNSRSSKRKRYFLLQKELKLLELDE